MKKKCYISYGNCGKIGYEIFKELIDKNFDIIELSKKKIEIKPKNLNQKFFKKLINQVLKI